MQQIYRKTLISKCDFNKVAKQPSKCSEKKVFWKYAANLQENTHAEMRFQQSCKVTLLKSYFDMDVPH